MARKPPKTVFADECEYLVESRDKAHAAFYSAQIFGGPSLHFHHRALDAAKGSADDFAEPVYAVLVAWGMHRMGPGGSKMRSFGEFRDSVRNVWGQIQTLQAADPASLDESGWADLRAAFVGIQCMASDSSLVGNSKVLAHALPRLIPPVDRRYTLNFLCGHQQIVNDLPHEWIRLRLILEGCFYPLLGTPALRESTLRWLANREAFFWDTSPLKVIDNLIIGLGGVMPPAPSGQGPVLSAI